MFISTILIGCSKEDIILPVQQEVGPDLIIANSIGIKLQTSFVTDNVAMNVKMEGDQTVTIKIFDITNKVISKEIVEAKSGDNILKVYTAALPPSAYRIGIYASNGTQLGITDFNKL